MADKTDEQLLADFVAGRSAALGALARRHETALLGLAAGVLHGRRDLACDAVQETWVRVIRFAGQFAGRSSVKTWLYRITVNQCRTLLDSLPAERATAEPPDAAAPPSPPERTLHRAETNHAVRRAVEQLEAERRLVVLLCYHGGMTHEQAAEILEIPLGTLKSRLHAALNELRAALRQEAAP